MLSKLREIAAGYEPALVASIVAAVFTLSAGLGISLANYSAQVDAILAFLAFAAPLAAGRYVRAKVTPLAKTRRV